MPNKIKVILLDFSYTLCFPKTKEIVDSLDGLYTEIKKSNAQKSIAESFIINQELLNFLQTLKTKSKLYVFTSGTMYTDPQIMQYLQPVFDGYITSQELKMPKSFPNVYKLIANKLDISVAEILFIDDVQKNVIAAQTAGAQAMKFTDNASVIQQIKSLIQL